MLFKQDQEVFFFEGEGGGHLTVEVVPSPADAISMAYHWQKRKA